MGVLQSIRDGKYDALLSQIELEVRRRRVNRLWDAQPGDRVQLSKNARPAYIAGRFGTIKEFRNRRILVTLDPGVAEGTRFQRGVLCNPESLEVVEGGK